MIRKIKTVYQNIESQVKVNGHLSQAFLEYIIFAEIILENIRQKNGIKAIVIGEKELKTSAFAMIQQYT